MKEVNEEKTIETGVVNNGFIQFFKKNEKTLTIAVIAVLVVIVGIFGYKKFIAEPNALEAQEQDIYAYNWFMADQYQLALDGDNQHMGFLQIIDEYGCTPAGNRAKYCAGMCQLYLGEYQKAIDLLEDYNGKDSFTKFQCEMLLGDANMELGNYDKAIKHYKAASSSKDEDIVAPTALYKLGFALMANNDNAQAKETFESIKVKFPASAEAQNPDLDKIIASIEFAE